MDHYCGRYVCKVPLSRDTRLLTMLKITWLALASAWGMIVIWRDRTSGDSGDGLSIAEQVSLSEDNTWRFGQIFPLLLLILPLVSFFEAFYGKSLLNRTRAHS